MSAQMKDKLRELAERWLGESPSRHDDYLATACSTRHDCARTILSLIDAEGDGGAVGVSPEDRFEQFVAAAIARSPEPLRELGEYLTRVLDEDRWPTADRLLLQLATHPARSGVVSDEDVEAACVAYARKAAKHIAVSPACMRAALEHFAGTKP